MRSNFSQPVNIGSEALGADHVINYRTERFEGVVRKLTAKKGVDVAFEHVGPDTFNGSCSSSNTASSARSAPPCATSARA
jgi:NADPH-dependent curcumin reductase CurA